jgi:cell division protein FtsN
VSRDYAKRSSNRRSKHSVPGWVWMVIGLLVGLFVAFLMYLNQASVKPTEWEMPALLKDQGGSDAKPVDRAGEKESEQSKLNFDFYNVLPEFEVPVPDSQPGKPAPKPVIAPPPKPSAPVTVETAPRPQTASSKPVTPKPVTVPEPGAYIIQAGSFSTAKDADTRRAQLALLGIVSKVQKVTVSSGKTYHRVQVGPLDNRERIEQVSELLKENSIEYMLVKQRG